MYNFLCIKCSDNAEMIYLSFQTFQRIEEPFLEAVKLTLSDRYTDNMDAIYRLLIKFILETMINALKDDISNGPNNV